MEAHFERLTRYHRDLLNVAGSPPEGQVEEDE
jgi:hypothetical protein